MAYYAYSFVYREKDGKMLHYISHCWAVSKAEAKGLALDEFDDEHPKCEQLSLLIREIPEINDRSEPKPQTDKNLQDTYDNKYITPQYTLK